MTRTMPQNLVRTTVRLDPVLKKQADILSATEGKTLQDIFNEALKKHLSQTLLINKKNIVFHPVYTGTSVDNLTRDDIYD